MENAGKFLDRARVLVTDDDPDIQKITRLNLMHEGFDVVQAHNGVECLDLVKSVRPDLILLDLMMPGMDGFETCKRLKSVDSTRDIPVIVCTARETLTDKLKCYSFKADDYLVKPYNFEDLLSRIYLHLGRANDLREREQKRRVSVLREVLREISDRVAEQHDTITVAVKDLEGTVNSPRLQDIKMACHEIIQVVETVREKEDPFYESPYLENHQEMEEETDEDLAALLEGLEPPDTLPTKS